MDTRYPSDNEAIELRKLHASVARKPRFLVLNAVLYLLFTLLMVSTRDMIPIGLLVAIFAFVFLVQIYLMLNLNILTRCPRCKRRMTVLKGSCTHCGMYLELQKMEKTP